MDRYAKRTVIGFALLAVLLTAGAAQGLSGTNTVDSGDIIDGQVTYPDIRNNALTGAKILDNSITGADVNEATLSPKVRFILVSASGARLGGNTSANVEPGGAAGSYTVTFPFPVKTCGLYANSVNYPNGGTWDSAAVVAFDISTTNSRIVFVQTSRSASASPTSFSLLTVCP